MRAWLWRPAPDYVGVVQAGHETRLLRAAEQAAGRAGSSSGPRPGQSVPNSAAPSLQRAASWQAEIVRAFGVARPPTRIRGRRGGMCDGAKGAARGSGAWRVLSQKLLSPTLACRPRLASKIACAHSLGAGPASAAPAAGRTSSKVRRRRQGARWHDVPCPIM